MTHPLSNVHGDQAEALLGNLTFVAATNFKVCLSIEQTSATIVMTEAPFFVVEMNHTVILGSSQLPDGVANPQGCV